MLVGVGGTHFLWGCDSGLHYYRCAPLLHVQTQKYGETHPQSLWGSGVWLLHSNCCAPSTLLWISFQQGVRGWSHYKLDGVGDTQSLWGCDSNFDCNYFCINNCYKFVGMGALCCCGAVTWARIAIAVPPSSMTRPKYMERVPGDSGKCNCCASSSESRLKYIPIYVHFGSCVSAEEIRCIFDDNSKIIFVNSS